MTPTRFLAMFWTVIIGVSLYSSLWLMLASLECTEARPMINSRTRMFERTRHAKHKQIIQSNIDEFPLIKCPTGSMRGHDRKCYPEW